MPAYDVDEVITFTRRSDGETFYRLPVTRDQFCRYLGPDFFNLTHHERNAVYKGSPYEGPYGTVKVVQ